MSVLPRFAGRTLSALDVTAASSTVLIAEKRSDGLRILGAGQAPSAGVVRGEITHLGDAIESVHEALRRAERSAGVRVSTLYYNFDDPGITEVHASGTKALAGEGQVTRSDAAQAVRVAERTAADFDRITVYFSPARFLIDDQDPVVDPVGIFGQKLEAQVVFFMARAEHCEKWARLVARTGVRAGVRVLSAWSTAFGILPASDRTRRRFVVDAGQDLVTAFVYGWDRVLRLAVRPGGEDSAAVAAVLAPLFAEWSAGEPFDGIFLTGDREPEEDLRAALETVLGAKVHRCSPVGLPRLEESRYASAAGLVAVADAIEAGRPIRIHERSLFPKVREKTLAFINEYF